MHVSANTLAPQRHCLKPQLTTTREGAVAKGTVTRGAVARGAALTPALTPPLSTLTALKAAATVATAPLCGRVKG
jgi:hypothetical protein